MFFQMWHRLLCPNAKIASSDLNWPRFSYLSCFCSHQRSRGGKASWKPVCLKIRRFIETSNQERQEQLVKCRLVPPRLQACQGPVPSRTSHWDEASHVVLEVSLTPLLPTFSNTFREGGKWALPSSPGEILQSFWRARILGTRI